jgi:hypothetical protein
VSVPVWGPKTAGWKLTLIVQLALAVTDGRQLLLCVNPLEVATLLIVNGTALLFVTVTGKEALEVPTSWLPKFKLTGETFTAATLPVPLKAMV